MKKQSLELRRKPRQGRSKALVAAIIDACQLILKEDGAEYLTTNRIAEVAGVTIGSLYQYFPNKEAILANLFSETAVAESDQIARQSTERVARKINESLRATIRELIHIEAALHVHFMNIHGNFYQEHHDFVDFHTLVDALVVDDYQQPSFEQWLPDLLSRYQSEIKVDDLEHAAFITAHMIEHLLKSAVDQNPAWLSDDDYLEDVERACMNFLCATDPG